MAIGLPQLPSIPTLTDFTSARDMLFEMFTKISQRAVQDDFTVTGEGPVVLSGVDATGTAVSRVPGPVTLKSPITIGVDVQLADVGLPAVGDVVDTLTADDWFRHMWSTGMTESGAITHDGAAGTVSVAANDFVTREGTLEDSPLKVYRDPGVTGLAVAANDVSYVYRDYNGGTPTWAYGTTLADFNGIDKVVNCAVARNGTRMNYISAENMNVDFQRKARRKFVEFSGYVYNGFWQSILGLSRISGSGLHPIVSAGKYFWFGNPHTHGIFDTTVAGAADANNFIYFYNRTPPWTQITGQKSINVTQYDNAGTLTALGANRWRTDWVYVVLDDGGAPYLAIVMGNAQYVTKTAALADPQPVVPHQLEGIAVLVGQITIQKNDVSLDNISQAGITAFTPASSTTASDVTIVDDTTTNASMYPVWVTAAGNVPEYISTTKIAFNPSYGGLFFPPLAPAAGTLTVSYIGSVRTVSSVFVWTNAMIAALGATGTGDILVCTLPEWSVVKNVYMYVTTADVSANAFTISVGRTGASYIDYIVASNAKSGATLYGDASAERGTNLTGYDLPNPGTTTPIYMHCVKTTSNLSTVSGCTGFIVIETCVVA